MKKTYIAPSTQVIYAEIHHMIASSPLGGSTPGDSYSSSDQTYSREGGWFDD